MEALLNRLGNDCCGIYYEPKGDIEDSVLLFTKRNLIEGQSLYYNFAKRGRKLKIWDYLNAVDKRVELGGKIYLQSSGFN